MLQKKEMTVVNDGKVVMVTLTVLDKTTGKIFKEVGRASCDLELDVFDLKIGTNIAESRAFEKAIKHAIKDHKHLLDFGVNFVKHESDIITSLTKRLK